MVSSGRLVFLRFLTWEGRRVFLHAFAVTAAHAGSESDGGFAIAVAQFVGGFEGLSPTFGSTAVNQIELHPRFQQKALRAFHDEHKIATESWSPLGRGSFVNEAAIVDIAARHRKTPTQVVIRWHLQLGNIVIPKSVTPARIRENFDVFGFELTADEMQAVAALDRDLRTGPHPDELN